MIHDYHKDADTYLDNIFIFHNLFYRSVFPKLLKTESIILHSLACIYPFSIGMKKLKIV
jgi:hypothetical protein